ncbi:MAG TPA: DUF1080 domain-containing protein [Fimbriimonadaceae bacterium]|nr:DUF1080 domain-containing protein [Fimbriimonadaceae bacterium]
MLTALVAFASFQSMNTLTPQEVKDGWQLLFDGKSLDGWHSYNEPEIGKGWKVIDGVLTITDADTAGDIVTDGMYRWFELKLEFKVGKGQNSGVIFRAADGSKAMWQSGPEVQIYDHPAGPGVQITGYLYDLYSSPIDAQKPAGEWNTMDIILSPKKCMTYINGVKYYEYVYQSKDFWDRVANSKFKQWPEFAKADKGRIGLQGDHGDVSFRDIKIKPIKG